MEPRHLTLITVAAFTLSLWGSTANAATAPGLLSQLPVSAERPAGYDRDKFNHWITVPGRGCDVRDFVLFRQNQKRPRICGNDRGRWLSVYDGQVLRDGGQLDVDHMVPLLEAFASGGRAWGPKQREQYANDLYPRSLIAVSLSSNRSKGDSDPADWLPPRRAYICRYVANWTAVKYRWRLSVDPREKRVLRKANGDYTYLAGDIAYHRDKFLVRGFDRVINVWGADHHGQVASLVAGVQALGIAKDRIEVRLGQML